MNKKLLIIKNTKQKKQLELNEAYRKVMFWFFAFPNKEFSLTDIVNAVKISKTTANRIITQLVKEGFLKIQELGNLWRITSNIEHSYTITRKVPYHLTSIYESGIVDHILKQFPNALSITLYGSYRKGDDTEESDIDIAIETLDNKEIEIFNWKISALGYRKNINIQILKFSRNKIDLNLFSNIANGITLHGFLEVRP